LNISVAEAAGEL